MAEIQKPKEKEKEKKIRKKPHSVPKSKKELSLSKKLKLAEKEIQTLKDQLLRSIAELDNYRKRTEREFSQIIQNANAELLKDVLSIVDDFDRSLKTTQENGSVAEFRKGIELIYQKLMTIIKKYGLEPMESIGTPFDVDRHDALLLVEKEGIESGKVIEEHEKGYLLNGQVLRHAKVIVSK